MDRTGEKRKRSSNFQLSETRLLVDTVLPFKDIIENKANDSFNIQEKNHAWEKIAVIFNSVGCGEVHRNPKVLKLKYEGIKKLLRRKLAEHKREMYVSGRESISPIKMEDYEEKMYSIVLCNGEDNTNTRYENSDLKMERNGHLERNLPERYDLSNTSTFDGDDAEMVELSERRVCSPEIEEITIKHEIESPTNLELVADNCNVINETASSEPTLGTNGSLNYGPRATLNENSKNLKWKQFNTRKLKVKKASIQLQHSRTECMNKLKYQDNEIMKQELELEYLKAEHELKKKILEKELEEKEAILKRNEEEHRLKMRLMEIQLKHKELELLSKMNS